MGGARGGTRREGRGGDQVSPSPPLEPSRRPPAYLHVQQVANLMLLVLGFVAVVLFYSLQTAPATNRRVMHVKAVCIVAWLESFYLFVF